MLWLILYHLIGPRRSSCATPSPAAPADEPATTAGKSAPEDAATSAPTLSPGDGMDADTDFGWFKKPTTEVDDTPTRQDIVDALTFHNGTAKVLRRQGYTGIHGQSYTRIHSAIDGLLYDLAALELEASIDA